MEKELQDTGTIDAWTLAWLPTMERLSSLRLNIVRVPQLPL
jgi:hypothetical protein